MKYFLFTVDSIPVAVGFSHFGGLHFGWIAFFLVVVFTNCILYRQLSDKGKTRWRWIISGLLLADELFKMAVLFATDQYQYDYLPLHLCSINIFLIALYTWKPWGALGNFLYTVCIPGTLAALLFPSWTRLPLLNAMHIHSFTVHILIALYPIVLTVNGDIKPNVRQIPGSLGLLALMAIPIYGLNLLLDTNFMFLMRPDSGNPLEFFQSILGSHLWGFPILLPIVILIMYLPILIVKKHKKD